MAAAFPKTSLERVPSDDIGWHFLLESMYVLGTGDGPLGPFAKDSLDYLVAANPLLKVGSDFWRCIWLFGKADGEQQVNWGIPSYNSVELCPECPVARNDIYPYTHNTAGARWRTIRFSFA